MADKILSYEEYFGMTTTKVEEKKEEVVEKEQSRVEALREKRKHYNKQEDTSIRHNNLVALATGGSKEKMDNMLETQPELYWAISNYN